MRFDVPELDACGPSDAGQRSQLVQQGCPQFVRGHFQVPAPETGQIRVARVRSDRHAFAAHGRPVIASMQRRCRARGAGSLPDSRSRIARIGAPSALGTVRTKLAGQGRSQIGWVRGDGGMMRPQCCARSGRRATSGGLRAALAERVPAG